MTRYEFDRDNFSFRKVTTSIGGLLWRVFKWVVASFSLAAVIYAVTAVFISTDTERKLTRENRMYEKVYVQMLERQELVSENIEGLKMRDDDIYGELFHTKAPEADPASLVFSRDSAGVSAALLLQRAGVVEDNFLAIFSMLKAGGTPPMGLPLGEITYAQTGAGTGSRISPFYKVQVAHDGLDLVAAQGEPVFATGEGTVQDVIHSGKGLGNVVEIAHAGGYVTRYCHLADITVSKGQKVRQGGKIGYVGISGNSFAPHLHYEVRHNGLPVNPIDYLAVMVGPETYSAMTYMSAVTRQSLD
ncbi:MAG: M23 family metallopeptidase [Bacteroidales bacterium]|nr:M23 family metallopeptidase [Bacteroidales bacterium]